MTEIAIRTEQLLDQTGGHSPDDLARAAWSILAEPGDATAGGLVQRLGAVGALQLVLDDAELADADLEALRGRVLPRVNQGLIAQAMRTAERFGVQLLTPNSPHWPTQINDLGAAAPFALWVRGNTELLAPAPSNAGQDSQQMQQRTFTAIVGARAATGYGEHVTMELSAGLVERGHTITSGAAYGIEGVAHRAALASRGSTIAFLAGGLDRFYPSGHDALLTRIVETGAVVSEVPCGTPPTKWRFLMRNRILAAFSDRLVVAEAGWRSGSLNTASHALDLGRPVGVVPGPVTSTASAGCHRLLRERPVTLVTNADEVAQL